MDNGSELVSGERESTYLSSEVCSGSDFCLVFMLHRFSDLLSDFLEFIKYVCNGGGGVL